MLLEQLECLDETKLQRLCDERCPESETLDFKRELPGKSHKQKREFLKDICAFANADGGDLVYGVADEKGAAKSLTPIVTEPFDSARRRLGQVLDAGLEPRLHSVLFQSISTTNGYILVVRVPSSFDGPHRYLFNNQSKFVMRNGTHTIELSYDQLRSAFDRTATLTERARRFRKDRLQSIIERRTWKPLSAGPVCVVHLIPIASMSGRRTIDVQAQYSDFTRFVFSSWGGGGSRTLNLDGLVVHPGWIRDNNETIAFNQIFRSGALEALQSGGISDPDTHIIDSTTVSEFFREAILKFIRAAQLFGFTGPFVVSSALLFVADYTFCLSENSHQFNRAVADRQHLVLPETWLDSLEIVDDADSVVRPMLDVLWQCFGLMRCGLYSSNGVWSR